MRNSRTYFEDIGAWPKGSRGIARTYVLGFILSLLLTIGAYLLKGDHTFSPQMFLIGVSLLAFAQFVVQVVCFLHLGKEVGSRAKVLGFLYAVFIVLVLVAGSIWIMNNLNERMVPSDVQMEHYMQDQGGI